MSEGTTSKMGFLGVLVSGRAMNVSPRFDGTLEEVYVETGDHVGPNQKLAELDTFSTEQQREMAEKSLDVAKQELAKAGAEYDFFRWCYDQLKKLPQDLDERPFGMVELKEAELQASVAEGEVKIRAAQVARQDAEVRQLEERLGNAVIRAPAASVVAARYGEPGATVGRGTPILRLVSLDELWVRFAVEEEDVACIEQGRPVSVYVDTLGQTVGGTIEHIAPEVDPALGILLVEAKLAGNGELTERLRPGMVARVSVSGPAPPSLPDGPPTRQAPDHEHPRP